MTPAQIQWLKSHPNYEPVGRVGGMTAYQSRGVLNPDGQFMLGAKAPALGTENGPFQVGIRVVLQAGKIVDPRGNPNERGYDQGGSGVKS